MFPCKTTLLAATLGLGSMAAADSAATVAQLTPLLDLLTTTDASQIMSGAIAACYLGLGDRAYMEEIMALDDWEVFEPLDGVLAYTPFAAENIMVTIYEDGALCDVTNTALNTTEMQDAVIAAFSAASVDVELQEEDTGCYVAILTEWQGAGTLIGRITSGGQDPVCMSDAPGANIRFEGFQ